MMKRVAVVALLAGAFLVITCGGEEKQEPIALETKTAALSATENIEQNLLDLEDVLKFLEASAVLEDALGMFGGSVETVCEPVPYDPEMGEEYPEPECYDVDPEPVEIEIEMGELVQEINEWLNDYVFVDSQVESDDGTTIVYLLDPEVFCAFEASEGEGGGDTKVPPDPEEPRPADDIGSYEDEDGTEECKEMLTEIPMRLQMQSFNEGDLDVEILFGAEQYAPVHIELHQDLLALEVDLAALKSVAEKFAEVYGEEGDDLEFPEVFEGKMRVELKKEAADQFKLTYSVTQKVKVTVKEGSDEYSVELGKSTMSATANSTSKTLAWTTDLNELKVDFPYQLFIDAMWGSDEEDYGEGEMTDPVKEPPERPADDIYDDEYPEAPTVSGVMSFYLSGWSASATLESDGTTVNFTNVGLGSGTSYLKKGNATIISVDFNKDHGRKADFSIVSAGNDVTLKVKPAFALSVLGHLSAIAGDLEEPPTFMADETFSVTFDSASEPELKIIGEGEDGDGTMKVVAGKLTMSSTAAPDQTVTVEAGQCLVGEDEEWDDVDPKPESHAILGEMSGGECK
jgi:hypothetical protein